jgi:hypothetical protein
LDQPSTTGETTVFVEKALPAAQSEIGEPDLERVTRETDATAPGDAVRFAV